MLKIVKSRVYNFDNSKPVSLCEPEPAPANDTSEEETVNKPTPEEIAARMELEKKQKAEADAKRFNEAVTARSNEIISAKRRQIDAEYRRIIESGNANAERMIEDAKAKTRAVFEAAEEECARLKETARREGFEAGFEAGKNDAVETCGKYLEAAARLIGEINAKKETYYISHEYELMETVLDMVKKITLSEIKTDPHIIDKIAANAAKNFRNSDYLKISLAEGEASREFVTDKEFVSSLISFIPEIEVEELNAGDAPEGTIVLDNGSEIVDASIPTQLEFLKEIMKNSKGDADGSEDETGGG